MRKLFFLAAVGAAFVAFVGTDVVKATVGRARTALRDKLTADVPLATQLAEARAQVDAYAESVIRGEVAAERLDDSIAKVEREVTTLTSRVERERTALVTVRRDLEAIPTSTAGDPEAQRQGVAKARQFRSMTSLLERRTKDLERLRTEREATARAIGEAKAEQVRLGQEIKVLAAEIESLEARTAAARTREAVGDVGVSSSGYAKAQERLEAIRSEIKERNKRLEYYEFERPLAPLAEEVPVEDGPAGAMDAIDSALLTWPTR